MPRMGMESKPACGCDGGMGGYPKLLICGMMGEESNELVNVLGGFMASRGNAPGALGTPGPRGPTGGFLGRAANPAPAPMSAAPRPPKIPSAARPPELILPLFLDFVFG
jgi:hypothetical protein